MKYSKHYGTKATPQSEPVLGKNMVKNSAGGFAFKITPWAQLDRFLILGSEGGTYYIGEKKLTKENAKNVVNLIQSDGKKVVDRIVEVSDKGLAPSNDPALFALALCTTFGDLATKKAAYEALPRVARIGTHLFHFLADVKNLRGWSRGLRTSVGRWYTDKPLDKLAIQLVKYRQRDGWAHRDALRLAHPKPNTKIQGNVFKWIIDPESSVAKFPKAIVAFTKLQQEKTVGGIVKLITDYSENVFWEMIPTDFLREKKVWEALIENGMPMNALVRNIGRLTSLDLIKPLSKLTNQIVDQITDEEQIKKSRMHPYQALVALKTYSRGAGIKGNLTWKPVGAIVDALDEAFYKAFKNVEPTGKNFLLGLDVSSSMGTHIRGSEVLSCCEGATAMALATAKSEKNYHIFAFNNRFTELPITAKNRLDDALRHTKGVNFGGTDCALPMIYALENRLDVDVFVVYTDNETWAGKIHPYQALNKYRQAMGRPAKLVVVGMASNGFTIADPNDAGMLDVVGFDSSTPQVISQFSRD